MGTSMPRSQRWMQHIKAEKGITMCLSKIKHLFVTFRYNDNPFHTEQIIRFSDQKSQSPQQQPSILNMVIFFMHAHDLQIECK